GFTLIELIVIIVILGILAVTAIPKYVDMKDEAEVAAVKGVAGALESALAINYAACALKGTASADCTTVDNCSDAPGLLVAGLPSGWPEVADTTALTADGQTAACSVVNDNSVSAPFTIMGAGF
ncbi:MAG: hypothetical protein PF495_02985, partial [Spirochaetales bacterium]|nr:hypothetical protein [Spirochaetales bacterium]